MGLLGFLTLAIGGASMLSDSCTKTKLNIEAKEISLSNGIPFYSDCSGNYYYIPTGEKCYKILDPVNKEFILKNYKTNRDVFNITKWQNDKTRREIIRKAKYEAKQRGDKYIEGRLGGTYDNYHTIYLFDVETMDGFIYYEQFPYLGKYAMAELDFDDKGIVYKNKREISTEKYMDVRNRFVHCHEKFAKDKTARLIEWRNV